MEEKIRLQKYIAEAGIASRRKAEQMIWDGLVKVNGEIITKLGTCVSNADEVVVDGKVIDHEKKVYYLFNKPVRTLCTVSDDRGRKTVMGFFKDCPERIFPVGRLDYETCGIIVMTNDGELSYLMTHPSTHLNKTYVANIDGALSFEEKERLEKGILLDDGMTAPAEVFIIKPDMISITIHEGRNRQIRRMFEALGHKVLGLTRTRIGPLKITGLKREEYRELTTEEIEQIKKECLKNKMNNHYIKTNK